MRSCIVLKDANAEKVVANGHYSFTFVFTFSVVVVDQRTYCLLSSLFPAETDVLVPVFSQSTDVVVVKFVVVLKLWGGGGQGGGSPGEQGAGGVRETGEERAGGGISTIAGSGREIQKGSQRNEPNNVS